MGTGSARLPRVRRWRTGFPASSPGIAPTLGYSKGRPFPWLLFTANRAFVQLRQVWIFAGGLTGGCLILAGHFQTALYCSFGLGCFMMARAGPGWRQIGRAAIVPRHRRDTILHRAIRRHGKLHGSARYYAVLFLQRTLARSIGDSGRVAMAGTSARTRAFDTRPFRRGGSRRPS